MATTSTIHLSPSHAPIFAAGPLTTASAAAASAVLQQNHDEHHVFFNAAGFHDHIVHHILTIYALGASPDLIQNQYRSNATYQKPARPVLAHIVADMADPAHFARYLGDGNHYANFLSFFKAEIDRKGWPAVLTEYLFARTARADDLLVRLFSGLLHPFIHLGFALEFNQPALIAEALSQAAVHDNYLAPFYLGAERAAAAAASSTSTVPLSTIVADIQSDRTLTTSLAYTDANKLRKLVTGATTAPAMLRHAARFTAAPATLAARTAEAVNTVAWIASAAQRAGKAMKFDFFLIHCLNSSIFLPMLMRADWLRAEDKARVLEWKVRTDLLEYVSRGTPKLRFDDVRAYVPRVTKVRGQEHAEWGTLFTRIAAVPDDGHAAKLVRAIASAQVVCAGARADAGDPDKDGTGPVRATDWLPMAQMATDAVDVTGGPRWIRDAGFAEAWAAVPERVVASL